MEIGKEEIQDKIKTYENKLKKLRKLCYNDEIKTKFKLQIHEGGGIKLEDLNLCMVDSDREDFEKFINFLSEDDIIEIKLKRLGDF